ncbi:iron-binding protein [Exophiala dermatitidis]|nr:iron-binding protein [Exophiala dermatitidis]
MSRRALLSVPRTISASVQSSVRPSLASQTASPFLRPAIAQPSQQRRSYHEKVLDHYSNLRNVGSMDKTAPDVGTGLVGAPACGDVMKLQIKVDPETQKISDVKFKTFGCGSAIASSSYLTELVRGMTLEQAGKIRNTEIAKELCLPPVKLHCSMLAEDAIKSAISNYYQKNPKARATDLGSASASMPKIEIERVTATTDTGASATA